jgi:hypothetical protein
LGLGADRLCLLDRRQAERKIADRRRRVRIVEKTEGNAPIGDAAVRVGLEYFLEQLLRLAIPERMLITHRSVKTPLRHLVAGRLEMHCAQSLVAFVLREHRLRECDAGHDRSASDGER